MGLKIKPTKEQFLEVFSYDSDTGLFYWKVNGIKKKKGEKAGSVRSDGYITLWLGKSQYKAHQVAWLISTGEWCPEGYEIDHINRKKNDNRIINLRAVKHKENMQNQKVRKNTPMGVRGLTFEKRRNRWRARATVNDKRKHLGLFRTAEEAINVLKKYQQS